MENNTYHGLALLNNVHWTNNVQDSINLEYWR